MLAEDNLNKRTDIAVDLLWVKPNNIGGAETVIRTLLDNFALLNHNYRFVLLTSRDNAYSFKQYEQNEKFSIYVCNIDTLPMVKRLIWQNIHMKPLLKKLNIKNYFCPVYIRPLIRMKGIKTVIIVHDLQQLHYPEYFTKARYLWCKYSWMRNIAISDCVVTISDFCKQDIIQHYKTDDKKIMVIYNPIAVADKFVDYDELAKKYDISEVGYYYTILSPLKHKNLITLLKTMEKLNNIYNEKNQIPKLLISGISGGILDELKKYSIQHGLDGLCVFTGYVSDEERNTLIKNCKLFLFPSVFEGFGMPVIEAMQLGKRVITTKCTSIPEVSQGKAIYLDDPYSVDEWIEKIKLAQTMSESCSKISFKEYNAKYSSIRYLELFNEIF